MSLKTSISALARTIVFLIAYGVLWTIVLWVGDYLDVWACGDELGCSGQAAFIYVFSVPLLIIAAVVAGWNVGKYRTAVHIVLLTGFTLIIFVVASSVYVLGLDGAWLYVNIVGAICLVVVRLVIVRKMSREFWYVK